MGKEQGNLGVLLSEDLTMGIWLYVEVGTMTKKLDIAKTEVGFRWSLLHMTNMRSEKLISPLADNRI